jgi:2-oxoisovalerate dehydrogenase E2 component (dihydrolipoyl transacylase)
MSVFKLPDLGEGLPDAVIREWYVAEGDMVVVDQPLVAMETAKALVDVPAPHAGKIAKLHGGVDDTIDTGDALITFESDEAAESAEEDAGTVVGDIESSNRVIASEKSSMQQLRDKGNTGGIKATPQVRMLAQQLGVDLSALDTSPITAEHVKQAAGMGKKQKRPQQNFTGKAIKLSQVRRAMVQSMEHSLSEIVPVTLVDDANIQAWAGKQDMTVRILRAVAKACQEEPSMNAFFDSAGECIYQQEQINIGLAVDTPDGLYVPVMKDITNRSDEDLRAQINNFKEYAKNKSFPAEELKGATILLSNFGTFAGRYASPVLVPPLVGIIGVGKARNEPTAQGDSVQVSRVLPLSVTADHRAVTGGEISRFLAALLKNLG